MAERTGFTPVYQRRGRSGYPPIASYGFLSDCHTGALVGPDGGIEWLCVPRFDAPSVFSTLLDRGAGSWRFGPYGIHVPASQRYLPGTNILETTWMTPTGWVIVRDALAIGPWEMEELDVTPYTRPPTDHEAEHVLVRTAQCIQGSVDIEMICSPVFDYGRHEADWEMVDTEEVLVADASAEGQPTLRLSGSMRLGIEGARARARHTLVEGETAFAALSWSHGLGGPRSAHDAERMLHETSHYWRNWLAHGTFPDHPWRSELQRSALVLKGLTYAPTGALLAALTTSLPETPGGERNWDYRFCWMRDATFTLYALHALGLDWEADDFMQYVADLTRNEDGSLQIMYGIDGERDLVEHTLDHLRGYEGARPVRTGNGAYDQRQNDVYGAVLDSIYIHVKRRDHISARLWPVIVDQVRCAEQVWQQPDQGIWEARGEPKHYVSSKLQCWVAMDRGARLAEIHGDDDQAERWQSVADTIRDDILEKGVSERGVFRQHYDTDALDASTLLVGAQPAPPARPTSACATPCSRSPTSSPSTASCCATGRTRPTTACPGARAAS